MPAVPAGERMGWPKGRDAMISDKCPPCGKNCSQGRECPHPYEPGDGWRVMFLLLSPVLCVLLLGIVVAVFRWL